MEWTLNVSVYIDMVFSFRTSNQGLEFMVSPVSGVILIPPDSVDVGAIFVGLGPSMYENFNPEVALEAEMFAHS